jgi:hypothetical protein
MAVGCSDSTLFVIPLDFLSENAAMNPVVLGGTQ